MRSELGQQLVTRTEPVREDRAATKSGEADLLLRAIELARAGEATAARVLLVDICRKNNQSELGWLWLASVARNPKEALACIKQVLRINPNNEHAQAWFNKLASAVEPAPAIVAQAPESGIASLAKAVAAEPVIETVAEPVDTKPAPAAELIHESVPETPVATLETTPVIEPVLLAPQAIQIPAAPVLAKTEAISVPKPAKAIQNTTLALPKPATENAPATAPVPVPVAKTAPAAEACPLCEASLEKPERCGTCQASIWPADPMQFVLNRQVDRELAARIVETLKGQPESLENQLRIALACCNLLDFAGARQHLNSAALMDFRGSKFVLDRVDAFLRRPTVLVVDDSATIRDVLVRMLGTGGMLPIPLGESWAVVATIQTQAPAAVLLDVTMPMMDGYEVCRLIRANRETKSLPVIMVSGHDGLIDKVVGKLAGASDYVSKPFNQDKLMKIVRGHVAPKK
jgi:twitching motility two-component system response regulator PilG